MPQDEASDPKIVARMVKIPPFPDEPVEETPTEPEAPVETPPEPPTPTVEAEGEAKTEETEEEKKARTAEQFDKLKEHNAELKKQLDELNARKIPTKNALDALIPEEPMITNVLPTPQQFPGLSPKEIKDTFAGLTDDQGFVDTGLMKETFQKLSDDNLEFKRKNAELEAQNKKNSRRMDDFERKTLMRQVHDMYPKLNPENAVSEDEVIKFDDSFYDAFQGEVIRQWTTGGKEDVWMAAKKWSDILYGEGMKKLTKEKLEAAELAKKNINATTAKTSSQRESFPDQAELITATQKGAKGALAERLRRAGM